MAWEGRGSNPFPFISQFWSISPYKADRCEGKIHRILFPSMANGSFGIVRLKTGNWHREKGFTHSSLHSGSIPHWISYCCSYEMGMTTEGSNTELQPYMYFRAKKHLFALAKHGNGRHAKLLSVNPCLRLQLQINISGHGLSSYLSLAQLFHDSHKQSKPLLSNIENIYSR